jgi:uncharacterized protein
VVLDELNKYAPKQGTSPLKELMIDIAARGRSLGVILIGAQQSATNVDPAIISNAALKVVGRLDAGEADAYRFPSSELRERASRFLPGTMVFDQPLIPAPIPLRFPFPAFATCVAEDQGLSSEAQAEAERDAFERVKLCSFSTSPTGTWAGLPTTIRDRKTTTGYWPRSNNWPGRLSPPDCPCR